MKIVAELDFEKNHAEIKQNYIQSRILSKIKGRSSLRSKIFPSRVRQKWGRPKISRIEHTSWRSPTKCQEQVCYNSCFNTQGLHWRSIDTFYHLLKNAGSFIIVLDPSCHHLYQAKLQRIDGCVTPPKVVRATAFSSCAEVLKDVSWVAMPVSLNFLNPPTTSPCCWPNALNGRTSTDLGDFGINCLTV